MAKFLEVGGELVNCSRVDSIRPLDLDVQRIGLVTLVAFIYGVPDMTDGVGEAMICFAYEDRETRDKAMVGMRKALANDEAPAIFEGQRADVLYDHIGNIRVLVKPWGLAGVAEIPEQGPRAKGAKRTEAKKGKLPEAEIVEIAAKPEKVAEVKAKAKKAEVKAEESPMFFGQLKKFAMRAEEVVRDCRIKQVSGQDQRTDMIVGELINALEDYGENEFYLNEAHALWAIIEESSPNRRKKNYKVAKATLESLPKPDRQIEAN
jgi:hypothetical protein